MSSYEPEKPKSNGEGVSQTNKEPTDEGRAEASNRHPGEGIPLTQETVRKQAGLGDRAPLSNLNDRQKADAVWQVVRDYSDIHIRVHRESRTLWVYDEGIWKPDGERHLNHAAYRALEDHYGKNVLRELKNHVRSDPAVEIDDGTLGLEPGYVAVKNGLLDLQAAADGAGWDALRPLEPEDYATTRLPVEYNPDADADDWEQFVDEVVEPGKVDAVQEYVGYTLHREAMPHHKALLLVGAGQNGKSTFLNVVRALLGEEHTTSKSLQQLGERFHLADLHKQLANINADLSEGSLSSTGVAKFKQLTGDDRVSAQRKHEDPFEFRPTAKHLYACNQVPDTGRYVDENDVGFWRRWIIVEFPHSFGPDERDPALEDRLTTDDNLSGVLNWAIEGWGRLREQGKFSGIEDWQETRRLWRSLGNSAEKFIAKHVEHDPDAEPMTVSDAYERYEAWCREWDEDPVEQRQFTRLLKDAGVGHKDSLRVPGYDTPRSGYRELGFSDAVPSGEQDDNEDNVSDDALETNGDYGSWT